MSVPEDSILRRHYEQHHQAAGIPEDSIQRRHYEQLQATASPVSQAATAAPVPAAAAPAASASVAPAPVAPQPVSQPPKGLFARLFGKLFGGS